jgi:molecular chaperone DnaK (HSP70)
LSSSELFNFFEPAVDKTIRLVKGQLKSIDRKVKGVILVGGFGQNSYLNLCVRDAVGNSAEVLRPANGDTAVARGALIVTTMNERLRMPNISSLAIQSLATASITTPLITTPPITTIPVTTPSIASSSMTGSRIATHSYGYQAHVLFNPKIHDESRKYVP